MILRLNSAAAVFIAVVLTCTMAIHELDYSDLQALGISCSPRDDCDAAVNRTFLETSCACDQQCQMYNDCCINAPVYFPRPMPQIRGLRCLPEHSQERGVYVISKCSQNWVGPSAVRHKCEYGNDLSDPMIAAPATDVELDITYRNRYCSECNYANPTNLQSWAIKMDCDSLLAVNSSGNISEGYVRDHITYKTSYPHRNKWGVFLWSNEHGREVFHPCRITFKLPHYLEENARLCRPGVISTCSPTWRRNAVRRKCGAYMAVVYANNLLYRNPHCALCNNEDLNILSCPTSLFARRRPPMSFTLLLDVNLNDGNRVGEVQMCPNGQKYDSFFKKCRTLVCALPGYRLEGERCVKR